MYSQTRSKEVEGGRLLCLTGRPPIGINQRKITFIIQSGELILLEYTPYIPVELFFQGKFLASPTVIVTAEHYRSGLKHDATSVWLEDVSASSFKICLREFQNFAGVHDDISVVSIEIKEQETTGYIFLFFYLFCFFLLCIFFTFQHYISAGQTSPIKV